MNGKDETIGLLSALFDLSFTSFITTKLVRFIYGLGLVVGGLFAAVYLISSFGAGFVFGLGMLVLLPLFYLLFAMYLRVMLEVLIVVFRIAENTEVLARNAGTQ